MARTLKIILIVLLTATAVLFYRCSEITINRAWDCMEKVTHKEIR